MGIPGESMRWDAGRSLDAMRLLRALMDQAKAASGREDDKEVVGHTVIATSAVAMAAVIGGIAGGAVGGVFTLLGGALGLLSGIVLGSSLRPLRVRRAPPLCFPSKWCSTL